MTMQVIHGITRYYILMYYYHTLLCNNKICGLNANIVEFTFFFSGTVNESIIMSKTKFPICIITFVSSRDTYNILVFS